MGTSAWTAVDLSTADVINTLSVAKGGTGTTTSTGTNNVVLSSSPTINTPTITNPTITGGGSWAGSPTLTTPTIADHTNAQHDHTNIVNGGSLGAGTVGSSQIVNGSITAADMQYGMVRQRQGGTSGDGAWNTTGTNNTDTSAKGAFVQTGTLTSNGGGVQSVVFPVAFTQAPVVFVTTIRASTGGWAQLDSAATTTGFDLTAWTATGVLTAILCQWVAIGQ